MNQDENVSQELIQEIADIFDIDEHFITKFESLQSKISRLKIKFEAHKITRSNDYGFKGKS
jgi:dihydroorotase